MSLEELRNLLKIPGYSEVSTEDTAEWMMYASSDPGFQILNDELIESAREDYLNVEVEADTGPSASKMFAGLETVLKWMERQPKCDYMQLLIVEWRRDLAARKQMKTVKQLT
ncbi:hypothetical protein X975_00160, partial [Stegodyphus mimosarum]